MRKSLQNNHLTNTEKYDIISEIFMRGSTMKTLFVNTVVNNGNPAANHPCMWFFSGSDFHTYFQI